MEEERSGREERMLPYQSPMSQYGGSILILTNPENELHKMELTLRNIYEDAEGNQKLVGDPLLNDKGINSVMGLVQTIVNQVTVMSDLKEREIPMLIDFLADTLAKDLMLNRVNYEIKSSSARDKIFFTTLASSFICLKRAAEGSDKRFWKGSQMEITNTVKNDNQRGGALQNIMGWKR